MFICWIVSYQPQWNLGYKLHNLECEGDQQEKCRSDIGKNLKRRSYIYQNFLFHQIYILIKKIVGPTNIYYIKGQKCSKITSLSFDETFSETIDNDIRMYVNE